MSDHIVNYKKGVYNFIINTEVGIYGGKKGQRPQVYWPVGFFFS